MHFIKRHAFVLILLLGLFIRLLVMFHDYSWDVNNHIVWAKDLHNRGFEDFYTTQSSEVYASLYPNYPPLAMFFFYLSYPLPKIIFSVFWWLNVHIPFFPSKLVFFVQERTFLAAMMKIPAIIADFGIVWLISLFIKKIKFSKAAARRALLLGTSLILFNPAFFYNSAYWGQIDLIPIFFVLTSVYLLLYKKNYILSGIFFTLGLLIKPTPIVYLPIYLFIFLAGGFKKTLMTFVASAIVFITAFAPFLGKAYDLFSPFKIYFEKIIQAQSISFVTNGAFNMWLLITQFKGIKSSEPFLLIASYDIWGYIFVGIMTYLIIDTLIRGKLRKDHTKIFYAFFLSSFACFLFLTKMHERYTMLMLPFLLLFSLKNRYAFKIFILLSIFSFLNLYHSWAVPKIDILFRIVDSRTGYMLFSAGAVLLFFNLLRQKTKKIP